MGRELGDVGLSPFSLSLGADGMVPCFCPALGLGLVKPGPAQSVLCWAEPFPWMQEVSAGQLCTAPAPSLAFGALVVGLPSAPWRCCHPQRCVLHTCTPLCHHSQGHHPSQEDQD